MNTEHADPKPPAATESFLIERIVDGKVSCYRVHGTGMDCFVEDLPTGGKRIFPFSEGWMREDGEAAHHDWTPPPEKPACTGSPITDPATQDFCDDTSCPKHYPAATGRVVPVEKLEELADGLDRFGDKAISNPGSDHRAAGYAWRECAAKLRALIAEHAQPACPEPPADQPAAPVATKEGKALPDSPGRWTREEGRYEFLVALSREKVGKLNFAGFANGALCWGWVENGIPSWGEFPRGGWIKASPGTEEREELERLRKLEQLQKEYDERVPDPRQRKYFAAQCMDGCQYLKLKNEREAAEESLACTRTVLADLQRSLAAANERAEKAEKERDHWKANHDEMIARNQILRTRPDLTASQIADRLGILDKLTAAQAEIADLKKENERMTQWVSDSEHDADRIRALTSERDSLRSRLAAAGQVNRQAFLANLNFLLDACDTAARRFELLHAGGVKLTNGASPDRGRYEIARAAKIVREWWAKNYDTLPSPAQPSPVPPSEEKIHRQLSLKSIKGDLRKIIPNGGPEGALASLMDNLCDILIEQEGGK